MTRRYCLYCFHTLAGTSDVCASCGHASLPAMRRSFWSRHPRHRQDEVAAKIGVVLLTAILGAGIVLWVASGPATGPGAGWLIVLPVALGAALWSNAEKFTRHRAAFRPSVFWGALGVCAAGVLAWCGAWFSAGLAVAMTLIALFACKTARRWQQDLIAGVRAP